jgi:CDP-glycerol glycerophosphotransferase
MMAQVLAGLDAVVPKRRRSVVVHSLPDFDDGALALLESLRGLGYRVVVLTEEPDAVERAAALISPPVEILPKNSARGRLHYLRAKTVFTTHGVYRAHRVPRTQTSVYVGHGESVNKSAGRWGGVDLPVRCTFSVSMSSIGKAFRCVEFDLPFDRVHVLGAPRNDRLVAADRRSVRDRVFAGADTGQRLLLSLPTYRQHRLGVRTDGSAYQSALPLGDQDLSLLSDWLETDDAVLLSMRHPLSVQTSAGFGDRIRPFDTAWLDERGLSLYQLLAGADVLLTDISSLWVDFLLTGRPIISLFPDLEEYRATRGLNIEPVEQWLPAHVVRTGPELVAVLQDLAAGRDTYRGDRERMTALLHTYRDADSAARVLAAAGLTPRSP